MEKIALTPKTHTTPPAKFSHGVRKGNILQVAGQVGFLPNQGVWLGATAKLDAGGVSRIYQDGFGRARGEVRQTASGSQPKARARSMTCGTRGTASGCQRP